MTGNTRLLSAEQLDSIRADQPPGVVTVPLMLVEHIAQQTKNYNLLSDNFGKACGARDAAMNALAAAQATIAQIQAELVSTSELAEYNANIAQAVQNTITQQGAVIAAMQETMEDDILTRAEMAIRNAANALTPAAKKELLSISRDLVRWRNTARNDIAQLAANHDAAVRAPLEAQLAALQGAVEAILVLVPPVEIPGKAYALAFDITQRLRSAAGITKEIVAAHNTRIQAEARADERRKVLNEADSVQQQSADSQHRPRRHYDRH